MMFRMQATRFGRGALTGAMGIKSVLASSLAFVLMLESGPALAQTNSGGLLGAFLRGMAQAQNKAVSSPSPATEGGVCADSAVGRWLTNYVMEWMRAGSPDMAQDVQIAPVAPHLGTIRLIDTADRGRSTQCSASYVASYAANGSLFSVHTFEIRDIHYTLRTSQETPGNISITTYLSDIELAKLKVGDPFFDRMIIGNMSANMWMQRAQAAKRASATTTAPPQAQPRNVAEAYVGLMQRAGRETEAIARANGYGPTIDAEKRRRASLTPAQRAKEDAWNAGPARGETICITQDGVLHCKTGK